MAKGCSTCGGASGVSRVGGIPTAMRIEMNQVTANKFVKMVYVGPTGTVTSGVSGLAYGERSAGDVMYVHESDVTANSQLWVSESDYVAPKLKPKQSTKVAKKEASKDESDDAE